MQVRIRKNAFVSTISFNGKNNKDFKAWLDTNGGQWFTVDTNTLFHNQYNLVGVPYRIMDSMIDSVQDDARINMSKCPYCGSVISTGNICTKHEECTQYTMVPFNEENTAFIACPNGFPEVKKCLMKDQKKFGSFTLEHLEGSLNYYRLKNNRERFEFLYSNGYIYPLRMSEANPRTKKLPITAKSFKMEELLSYLEEQTK